MATKDITDEQVVRAAARFHREGGEFVDALLAAETGQPLKVCERAIYRAEDRGLVDWGVSARTCWPTPLGTDLYLSPKGHSA